MTKRRIFIALGIVLVAVFGFFTWMIGPRNVLGMIFYDHRREGSLVVGTRAPDVVLMKVDGTGETKLSSFLGGKPLVIVFGSFT